MLASVSLSTGRPVRTRTDPDLVAAPLPSVKTPTPTGTSHRHSRTSTVPAWWTPPTRRGRPSGLLAPTKDGRPGRHRAGAVVNEARPTLVLRAVAASWFFWNPGVGQ